MFWKTFYITYVINISRKVFFKIINVKFHEKFEAYYLDEFPEKIRHQKFSSAKIFVTKIFVAKIFVGKPDEIFRRRKFSYLKTGADFGIFSRGCAEGFFEARGCANF